MSTLSTQRCAPCSKETPRLSPSEGQALWVHVPQWQLNDDAKALEREFVMCDFLAARDLIDAIALVAEAEDHHPDLHLTHYRNLRIVLSTHAIGGLSKNDFILAAKIDALPKKLK